MKVSYESFYPFQKKLNYKEYYTFEDDELDLDYTNIPDMENIENSNESISNAIERIRKWISSLIKNVIKKIELIIKKVVGRDILMKKYLDKKMDNLFNLSRRLTHEEKQEANYIFKNYATVKIPKINTLFAMMTTFELYVKNLSNIVLQFLNSGGQNFPSLDYYILFNSASIETYYHIGIFIEKNNLSYKSPFVDLPNSTFGVLGFTTIDNIQTYNNDYLVKVFQNLKILQFLKIKLVSYLGRFNASHIAITDENGTIQTQTVYTNQQKNLATTQFILNLIDKSMKYLVILHRHFSQIRYQIIISGLKSVIKTLPDKSGEK